MDLSMFSNSTMGDLVRVTGSDPMLGDWEHRAFVPAPLPEELPPLSMQTHLAISDARAALAALDSSAQQLPNPTLLRLPALRLEAQSTSELEGTYAPLAEVFAADEDDPASEELAEILNYVTMANHGFDRLAEGWPVTTALLSELQGILLMSTAKRAQAGQIRPTQVVIGRRPDAGPAEQPIVAARFVPSPPGPQLETGLRDLLDWMGRDHVGFLDPVMAAGMAHYQFETLHPFTDGNGRIGRFLIVLHFLQSGTLTEPTLTVSPWFEARRHEYYDALLGVSTRGDWDSYLAFFAAGIGAAATNTREEMLSLVEVQRELHDAVRASSLRAGTAHTVIDFAVANPSFTVRRLESVLDVGYGRANKLVGQLVDLGVLRAIETGSRSRRFFAPRVVEVLTDRWS
ncbi:MAG: Fic family protein [Pseudoclavibacter sp.]